MEEYQDAMARGRAAVMATRSKKNEEVLTLQLGNILPGQTAQIKLGMA